MTEPSKTGQAITFQSLLQYVLMALVGFLGWQEHESSKLHAWLLTEVQEARLERQEQAKEAREDREASWRKVDELRSTLDAAMVKIEGTRRDVGAVKKAVEQKE